MFNSKKGFLFTLDIMLCVIIIVMGFLLAWSSLSTEPPKEQPYLLADSIASLMVDTKNYEILDKFNPSGGLRDEIENNQDLENSMWEQIGIFYLEDPEHHLLDNYIGESLNKSLPPQYAMAVFFDGVQVYNSTLGALGHNQSEAPFLVISKRLIVLVMNDTILKGPYIGEVRVW